MISAEWLFALIYLPRLLYAVEFIPSQCSNFRKREARETPLVTSFSGKAPVGKVICVENPLHHPLGD